MGTSTLPKDALGSPVVKYNVPALLTLHPEMEAMSLLVAVLGAHC